MALKILVVDDEAPARENMGRLLAADELAGEVFLAGSVAEAHQRLAAQPVDVVLLDIHMPGASGLDLARALHETKVSGAPAPQVIFVTADARPAVHAFELEARDYLLKPVRPSRLHEALRKITGTAAPAPEPAETPGRIAVVHGSQQLLIPISSIRFAQAHGDYARIHTETDSYLVRIALSTIEKDWADEGFVRVHRSWVVNLNFATRITQKDGKMLIWLGETELPISRRSAPVVRARLKELNVGSRSQA